MTIANWVQAQKADPTINQVVTWMESEKLDTVKVGDEMSQELKQYLRQQGEAVFVKKGFCIGMVIELDETEMNCNW